MKNRLLGSWWVLGFAIVVFGIYEQASTRLTNGIAKLQARVIELEASIAKTTTDQEELKLQVASQSDPAWIELLLIKGLGLVPEGYKKIYFEEEQTP